MESQGFLITEKNSPKMRNQDEGKIVETSQTVKHNFKNGGEGD